MISRYNAMLEGSVLDSEDFEVYPDPLSTDILTELTLTNPAYRFEVEETSIQKFFALVGAVYGLTYCQYDDLILNWNDVAHITQLEEGDVLFFPEKADLSSYLKKARK